MSTGDVLRPLLVAADDVGRVFGHGEVATWPEGALDVALRLGLLRQAATQLYAPCPNCADAHLEAVTVRIGPAGTRRFFIACPEALRVEVTAEMCVGWEVDRSGLAAAVSATMGITQAPKLVIAERLWRLGRLPWPPGTSTTREVVLAMRLCDQDASTVAAHIGRGGRAIVLVPHGTPDERVWRGHMPAVVPLSQVATLAGGHLHLDSVALCEMVVEADKASAQQTGMSLDALSAKKVRRYVDAAIESKVTNEGLVQAYRIHGSYRKAADALNADGYITDRWAVERAVKAAGGAKAVMRNDDSPWAARTVASQSRDRAKKVLERH